MLCHEYKVSLNVAGSERKRIETATRNQYSSTLWYKQRKCRLTALNFGVIVRRRITTPVAKLVQSLLYGNIPNAVSLRWGNDHENDARQAYLKVKKGIILTHSGLVIDETHGWLACSPDDLAQDTSLDANNQFGLVEYKCPYSARDVTVEEACKQKNFMSRLRNNTVTLKQTHHYYYQIQGQMAICRRSWCDFVIWTPCGISIERIDFNTTIWEDMMKLEQFYDEAVLPELASPRFPQGQPIREPWLNK